MSRVPQRERQKQQFLNEYRALCEKYEMMVLMYRDEDDNYTSFAVADLQLSGVADLGHAIEEMSIEDLFTWMRT